MVGDSFGKNSLFVVDASGTQYGRIEGELYALQEPGHHAMGGGGGAAILLYS